jgi:hypothetical protein
MKGGRRSRVDDAVEYRRGERLLVRVAERELAREMIPHRRLIVGAGGQYRTQNNDGRGANKRSERHGVIELGVSGCYSTALVLTS